MLIKKTLCSIFITLFFSSFFACSYSQLSMSPEKKYLSARLEFNNLLTRYLAYRDQAPEEVKDKWKRDIEPIFLEASFILDVWGTYLKEDIVDKSLIQERQFFEIKDRLLDMLLVNQIK